MLKRLAGLFRDEQGATMVEYALMLVLIAVVSILVVTLLGQKTANTFGTTANAMNS